LEWNKVKTKIELATGTLTVYTCCDSMQFDRCDADYSGERCQERFVPVIDNVDTRGKQSM